MMDSGGVELPTSSTAVEKESNVVPLKTGEDPKKRKRKHKHYTLTFEGDEMARTTDPKIMKEVYRHQFVPLVKSGFQLVDDPNPNPDVLYELLISPKYLEQVNNPEFTRLVTTHMKKGSTIPRNPNEELPVIKRTAIRDYQMVFQRQPNFNKIVKKNLKRLQKEREEQALKKSTQDKEKNKSGGLLNREITVAEVDNGWRKSKVTLASVGCLNPGQFLNDEVLDFGLMYYSERAQCPYDVLLLPVYAWDSYMFWDQNIEYPPWKLQSLYKLLTKRGKEPDILQREYIVIPINREGHRFLVIICNPFPSHKLVEECRKDIVSSGGNPDLMIKYVCRMYKDWFRSNRPPIFLTLDGIKDEMNIKFSNYMDFYANTLEYILRALHKMHIKHFDDFIQLEMEQFPKVFNLNHFRWQCVEVPPQRNNPDCGLLCMSYLEMWLEAIKKSESTNLDHQDLRDKFSPETMPSRQILSGVIRQDCEENFPQNLAALDNFTNTSL